jgi:hypothetical protein
MKAMLSPIPLFLTTKSLQTMILLLIFTALIFPIASFANDQNNITLNHEVQDYCYKPSKPLFFATEKYKRVYAEDLNEYRHCRQGYIEMQERVALMKAESEKNAKLIRNSFINTHY